MKSPITGKEMVLVKEKRTLSFRKEEFEVVYHCLKCEDSGESFTTTQLDELNLNQLYNQYRAKNNIPFPDQIKMIRKKYNLAASKMSEVLGFGINSYRNYEADEIPSLSNARLIQAANDPWEFKKLVMISNAFEGKSLDNILQRIDQIIHDQKMNRFKTDLENYFLGAQLPDSYTGYRLPNLEIFTEMVVFFTERMQPFKTKLNKLLFYADFTMFNKWGMSISGMKYRAIEWGPVPHNFEGVFEYLANKDDVDIFHTTFTNGSCGNQFKPNSKHQFNAALFTREELMVLEEIATRFKDTSIEAIIDISHLEKAWIENEKGRKIIDYNYGFELN